MVIAIVIFAVTAGDNTSRPAITRPRSGYRVFMVVSALLHRQLPLEVTEHRPVLLIGERPALFDQTQCVAGFLGQLCDRYVANLALLWSTREAGRYMHLKRECGY